MSAGKRQRRAQGWCGGCAQNNRLSPRTRPVVGGTTHKTLYVHPWDKCSVRAGWRALGSNRSNVAATSQI
jgi:hypothetical protein